MKNVLICFLLTAAVIIPLACGNQNNIPVGVSTIPTATRTPTTAISPTSTPTGTITPATFTFTPTITATPTNTAIGAFTATPTATYSIPTPVYEHTYGTSGSPNGMVILGGQMSVAENSYNGAGGLNSVQFFSLGAGGVTNSGPFASDNPAVLVGIPTPALTPPWAPTTITLSGPQGFIYPASGNYAAILDINGSGGATLYQGSNTMGGYGVYGNGYNYLPNYGNAYGIGGTPFSSPKGLTVDSVGSLYVADTGNHQICEFNGTFGYTAPTWVIGEHFWTGNGGQPVTNTVTNAVFTSKAFISPYAIACDPVAATLDNVWVADTGYYNNAGLGTNYSVVSEYSKYGGVTLITCWPTVQGCRATGIAIAPSTSPDAGDIFIADSTNNAVEIYDRQGNLLSVLVDKQNLDTPNGQGLAPAGLAFNGSDLWVGDINNDCITSFMTQ